MGGVKLLKASAGSGKTYRLAYEYVRNVVEQPLQYRHILAVTFTNKATEEMKSRIVREINDLAQGKNTGYLADLERDLSLTPATIAQRAALARTKILHDYSNFAVLTIDKFFQRIIRLFIRELGIDLNFTLELQTGSLLSAAADALIDEIALNEALKKWIAGFVSEKIDENKKWEIKTGLTELGTEIFGEGYKRSAAEQVSREKLGEIVSAASSEAAAIKERMVLAAKDALAVMADNGLSAGDFAGGSRSFANYFAKVAIGDISAYGKAVAAALETDDKWYTKTSPRKAEIIGVLPYLKGLLQKITSEYDRSHHFLNSVELLRANYRNFALLTDLGRKVREICVGESIMPISETNDILHKLISGNDTPFIFEKAGNHFNRFMIDEFQDTSTLQWENFIPLLKNAVSQSEGSPVLLVGDVKQSIYRWRGGDWRILAGEIERTFPGLAGHNLNTNYRSFPGVVEFNNNIIDKCVETDNARLNADLSEAAGKGLITPELENSLKNMMAAAYEGHRQTAADTREKGYVNVTVYEESYGGAEDDSDGEEPATGQWLIWRIEEIQQRGYRPGDIAILVRTGADGIKVADMLLRYKASNPGSKYSYNVVTQEALLIDTAPVITFVMACLRMAGTIGTFATERATGPDYQDCPAEAPDQVGATGAAGAYHTTGSGIEAGSVQHNATSGISVTANSSRPVPNEGDIYSAIYNNYLKRPFDAPLPDAERDFLSGLRFLAPEEAFESIIIQYRLNADPTNVAYLQAFHEQILQFSASTVSDIPLFVKWWDENGGRKSVYIPRNDSAMSISTIHKAKGLQYKVVVIPYCNWSMNPHNRSVVWADAESAFDGAGRIPVGFSEKMRSSYMAADYFNELVMSHIDNMNIFYVAVTRAMEELHIMMPARKKEAANRIDSLVLSSIEVSGEAAKLGGMAGKVAEGVNSVHYEFGRPGQAATVTPESGDTITLPYNSYAVGGRLSRRTDYTRYVDLESVLAPRDYGILMHRAFESAKTPEDIAAAVSKMETDGYISPQERTALAEKITLAFDNPVIRSWFAAEWENVYTENDIITPGGAQSKRPDRVMTLGRRAVVVDYKFGANRQASHSAQISAYLELLGRMGYTDTEGYIWYVTLNEVVRV